MTDRLSLGAIVASTLGMAAEACLKGALGEAGKTAYNLLKAKIAAWAGGDVVALEQEPASKGRQLILAETIDKRPEPELAAVKALAIALHDALIEGTRRNPIGIDIGILEAARVQLAEINVTSGTGFRAAEVKTTGDFTTGPIIVGAQPGKSER